MILNQVAMSKADVMRACLAEAGFPDADVSGVCAAVGCGCDWPTVYDMNTEEMARAVHRAFLIMGCPDTQGCYACWDGLFGCNDHTCEALS